ncbi:hypothetical protein DL98DRAFT_569890 [Cadophora sp. DSE1049]|nr:hypothetical protein DL98DRAFT_569890 [Cadophora sp. DSE1049]
MSSCLGIKLIRVAPGLTTQASHLITSNRALRPEPIQTRSTRSRIPVPSQRNTPSSIVALPATSPTLSRKPISVPTSASRKTEDSILKHVERVSNFLILIARIGPIAIIDVAVADLLLSSPGRRILLIATEQLRKVQAAKSTYKTSTFKTASKVAQPRPVSRPASRVPSSTHSTVSSSPSVARTDSSIDAHIQRITRARESRPNSSRSSPATSRRVTPTQPLLVTKKTVSATVSLTTVDSKLAELSVAPSPAQAKKPSVPGKPSCLKKASAGKSTKSVHFVEYGGWLNHFIRVSTSDSAPNLFIPDPRSLDYTLLRPPSETEDSCTDYKLQSSSLEICWPPEHRDPSFIRYSGAIPSSCLACRDAASKRTPHTRSHANMQSLFCTDCMNTPARRPFFTPAIEIGDDDDGCSACQGPHHRSPETCQIFTSAYKSNVNWLYSHYPERWPELDAILAS